MSLLRVLKFWPYTVEEIKSKRNKMGIGCKISNKAIFLDRDGTINVDYCYVHKRDKLDFIVDAPLALKKLYDAGYLLIIIIYKFQHCFKKS